MRKFISRTVSFSAVTALALSMVIFAVPKAAFAYAGGDGTEGNPYQVSTCADVEEMDANLSSFFTLTADLNCAANGNDTMIEGNFSGFFDGNDHSINVDIQTSAANAIGLFQAIAEGHVQDLTVTGSVTDDSSGDSLGLVAGYLLEATLNNVHSSGTVSAPDSNAVGGLFGGSHCGSVISNSSSSADVEGGTLVGGLSGYDACEGPGSYWYDSFATGDVQGVENVGGAVGQGNGTHLENVYTTGSVQGQSNVGGLVGALSNPDNGQRKVFHSHATGNVTGVNAVGGLIGSAHEGVYSQSYATGDVEGTGGGTPVGGFIGDVDNDVIIRDSYARGDVEIQDGNNTIAGGFVGRIGEDVQILRSYSTGAVTSPDDLVPVIAGFIGQTNSGVVLTADFWDTQTSGLSEGCGDLEPEDCAAVGRNTATMKTQSNFTDADWDFTDVWDIDGGQNNGYPILLGGPDQMVMSQGEGNPVETILNENQFHGGGVGQEWNGDDDEFEYELPFSFSFYGQDYDTVFVSTNGYVGFGPDVGNYDFAIEEWEGAPVIVAMSGDLDTNCGNDGEDIYLTATSDTVIFRWQAADHRNCSTLLNFEIVLHSDGTFELNYGDMEGHLNGVGGVGVSNGAGSYRLSEYNLRTNFDNLDTSAWNAVSVADEDDDGVDGVVEEAAPNGGDANDDGTPDSEQETVTSLVSPVSDEYVVLEAATCATNTGVSIASETTDPKEDDGDYQYPAGLLSFTLTGCGVGATETITQYYFGDYDISKLSVRKYDSSNGTYTRVTGATLSAVTIGGKNAVKVVYEVTDGGALDADGSENGEIADPAGIAVLGAAAPNTGMAKQSILLPIMLLFTAAGLFVIHRRYAQARRKA